MPEFNLIQRPDLILRLQQMLGLRQAHVTPTLGEVITPVVVIGDVRDESTGQQANIVRRFWASINVAAGGVGFFSQVQIRNPPGSGVLVTVERIACIGGGGAAVPGSFEFQANQSTGDFVVPASFPFLTNPGNTTSIQEWFGSAKAIVSNRNTSPATFATGIGGVPGWQVKHVPDSSVDVELPNGGIVLPNHIGAAGDCLFIGSLTANQTCSFSIGWREEFINRA